MRELTRPDRCGARGAAGLAARPGPSEVRRRRLRRRRPRSAPASRSRRARTRTGLDAAAAPLARRPCPGRRKGGGDDGGGGALILATRSSRASRSRRARTGAGLAAAPPARRPGPGRRKGGSNDGCGGALIVAGQYYYREQSNVICHVEQAVVHKMNAILLLLLLNYFLLAIEHLFIVVRTKANDKQEVEAYLRTLKLIIQDILADLGFENLQYLWFEYQEVNGERRYGPANGAIWWQITVRQMGKGHVLVALIIFQDGSWVKINLSCEPIYGEMDYLNFVSFDWREYRRSLLRTADECL